MGQNGASGLFILDCQYKTGHVEDDLQSLKLMLWVETCAQWKDRSLLLFLLSVTGVGSRGSFSSVLVLIRC